MRRKVIDILPVGMLLVANFLNMSNLCYQLTEDQGKPSLVAAEIKTEGKPVIYQKCSRALL